jgi:OmpA-OmpF porin, OOP family
MRFKIASFAFASAIATSGFFAGSAAGQPAYTAEEIVQMFIKSADLGKARAICIGSAEECAAKADAPAEPVNMQVNFEYNSDILTPEARETLAEFAKGLNDPRLEVATFDVEGHTDAYGGDAFNMDLSKRRAAVVSDTLASLGVDPSRIKATGVGESKPVSADPFDPANRRVNARIVLPNG